MVMTKQQKENALTLDKSLINPNYFSFRIKELSSTTHSKPMTGINEKTAFSKFKILLVDDEEMVLILVKTILGRLGYHVDAFSSPSKALKAFKKRPNDYLMLITDQVMPIMLGTELIQLIHKVKSSLPVVMLSGLSKEVTSSNISEFGISKFLMKPVSLDKLDKTIHELININHKDAG